MIKRGGKQFRRSLKTNEDRKLAERKLAELRAKVGNLTPSKDAPSSFEEAAKTWLAHKRHEMKPSSALRRETCIKALKPFFEGVAIRNISRAHCVERGVMLENSAESIKRKRIIQAKIAIPSKDEFRRLVQAIRQSDGRPDSQARSKPGADLVELMAYSGMRLREATSLAWKDVDFIKGALTVRGGEHGTKNGEERTIPMTSALRELQLRLRSDQGRATPEARVSLTNGAKTTLRRACAKLALPSFTHHDFRHFFATSCIEAGVDIPTVSRWLGHKDGGALAMRVYGHLRDEHSQAQIKRVTFSPGDPTNLVPLVESTADAQEESPRQPAHGAV